ncbi:MAG: sigma-54 dependent transcriptional regulator [Chitinispirillaceae bacterium]|nr:sigma-54 dependent transcriptional regulator [Chitinispirillaceae bacterium]
MVKPSRILLVEDDEATRFGYEKSLGKNGYAVLSAESLAEARAVVGSQTVDAVILDLQLPDGNSLEWIPEIKKSYPHLPVIVITGMSDIPTAVKATKYGAENFLTKPAEIADIMLFLDRGLEVESLRRHSFVQQRIAKSQDPFFGTSDAMVRLVEHARVAADSESVILLQGETGTGKGVLARWIHDHGSRAAEAFIELNCSSIKGDLLRSELFGHVRGSFTSAIKDKEGLFEIADRGTLFLDEIGDMDAEVQTLLLKTIEERSFRRIGENRVRHSDFRLLCATNRDLLKDTESGRFRKDLYYRICVFPIELPAMRTRTKDIKGLAEHLLAGFGYSHLPLDAEVLDHLAGYGWPGNVRELRNVLERAMLFARGQSLAPAHFPGLSSEEGGASPEEEIEDLDKSLDAHIIKILRKYDGDKNRASKALGISLSSLYRKLERIPRN